MLLTQKHNLVSFISFFIECRFLKEKSLSLLQENECRCLLDQTNKSECSENTTAVMYSTSKEQVSYKSEASI